MLQATRILWVFLLFLSCLSPAQVTAADATSFNPTTVAVVPKGAGGVPVGTVIAWPVSRNPEDMDKWLECDGRSISSAVYPELFAVVGGSVPDFRGLFLRGVGGASAALGQSQGDAMRNFTARIGLHYGLVNEVGGIASASGGGWWAGGMIASGMDRLIELDPSLQVPTANENRLVHRTVFFGSGDDE